MEKPEQQELDELFRRQADAFDATDAVRSIRQVAQGDLKPVKVLPGPVFFTLSFLAIAAVLAIAGALVLTGNGWSALTPLARASVFVTLAASAALLAFSLSLQMVPGSRVYWTPSLIVIGLCVLILLVLTGLFQFKAEPQFLRAGLICMRTGTPFAIPAAILFAIVLRRGAVLSPRRVGMLCGMLAGLVSMAVLEVHCPNLDLLHIVMWHFGIPVLGAFLGYLLGYLAQMLNSEQPS